MTAVKHPAKFSDEVLAAIRGVLNEREFSGYILDPFAGVGRIHELQCDELWIHTVGIELEPEWAVTHPSTNQGDATNLPFVADKWDAVITSPPYGNRMADSYVGDGSRRHTYCISLGRALSEGSAAGLQWGDKYRTVMADALVEILRVLKPGGLFVLNISDHVRGGEFQNVPRWFRTTCEYLGFKVVDRLEVPTPRMRHGANADARASFEMVYVMVKP